MKETPSYRTVEAQFFGDPLVLRTEESPEFAQEVVRFVQSRISEAQKRVSPGTSPHLIALLALIDLGEEYLKAKDRTEAYQERVRDRTHALLQELGLNSRDH